MIKTIDTIILTLLLVLTIKGIWRGFKKELISLLTYGAAFLIATSQIDNGTRFFERTLHLHPIFGYFLSYSAVFFVVFLVMKIFAKKILKMISKEPSSGLVDSIGGAVFGFCLGMIMVGITTSMLKPIPVMNRIFQQKQSSLFLQLSEKFAEPVAAVFMVTPADKIPLGELLSKGAGENLILPDMMKGLLGEQIGALSGASGGETSNLLDTQIDFQKMLQQAGGDINAEKQTNTIQQTGDALQQVLGILKADTTAQKKSVTDLLKLIKQ